MIPFKVVTNIHHISTALLQQIRFGLLPFRSPLLRESRLISSPHSIQMLPFEWFALPCLRKGAPLRAGVPFGDRRINGRMRLPGAYRSLPRPSSSSQPSHPPDGVLVTILKHTQPCMAIIVVLISIKPLRPSPYTTGIGLHPFLDLVHGSCTIYTGLYFILFVKEVIRPQVPLRPPCYDFSPLSEFTLDDTNMTPPHVNPPRVKRRAVCARSRDVFTARW